MPIHGLDPALLKDVYPAHFDIEAVIRPNILALHPYRCARDDYQTGILLDANENALGHSLPPGETDALGGAALNRYPDPAQGAIKARVAALRLAPAPARGPESVFLGVGSDEVIDLLMRVCCVPGTDKILVTPPTYGMYAVCAQVNDVAVAKVPLATEDGSFQLRVDAVTSACAADPSIKLVFLCSPGNPTGTLIPLRDIVAVLDFPDFAGIVVVDEAYIDFAGTDASAASLVAKYANLCVMQTLSKSFGLAAIRLGIALAHPALIQVLTNTKAPYNISTPSSVLALSALSPDGVTAMQTKIETLIASRQHLLETFRSAAFYLLGVGPPIGGHAANFLLVPILDVATGLPDSKRALAVYKSLAEEKGVVVRFRGNEHGCAGCLRITVGTEQENAVLLQKLEEALRAT